MLPELDYLKILRRAEFPFFILRTDDIRYADGLVIANEKVVDDRNQKGHTLGQRRLLSPHKLYLIKDRVSNVPELIDCRRSHFIDNKGFYFTYVKTKTVYIVSHRIREKTSHDTYTTLFCKGINFFFVVPRFPYSSEWAQVIYIDSLPWKLYSTSEDYIEKYRRKI